ncbi:hypothetical protein CPB83DRAFT_849433 [Crepidotus variabilis]|uniref:F-box domain-containing protein n=1 Tax=Crepidotus variabilis TaxID=179855 RepID=A0A9P6EK05_9AGAR|nr:hypothetical protein CPB83DRAFT_849433 [Crepidotus variabilis]
MEETSNIVSELIETGFADLDVQPTTTDARRRNVGWRANAAFMVIYKEYRQSISPILRRHRSSRLNVDLFWKMPIDILFEILTKLHPIDLLHIQKASSEFCLALEFLGESIWKAVYLQVEFPAPPPGASYSKWTASLFAPQVCEKCNNDPAPLNHLTHQRLCEECHHKLFTDHDAESETKELCAQSKFSFFSFDRQNEQPGDNPFDLFWPTYYTSDMAAIGKRLSDLKRDVEEGLERATDNLKEYRASQAKIRSDVEQSAIDWGMWSLHLGRRINNIIDVGLYRMEIQLKNRLIASEAFAAADVNNFRYREMLSSYISDNCVFSVNRRRSAQVRRFGLVELRLKSIQEN